ncbi:MAG: hypothetical protein Roseis2KO_46870 [Roseivirga sp.]
MSKFLSYKRQAKASETRQAFIKAKTIYGKHMEDAPVTNSTSDVSTDFDELIGLRNSRSDRFQKGYRLFLFFLILGLIAFFIINFIIVSNELG